MMSDNPVMAKVNAFHQRHGPDSATDGTAIFYPDGAMRDVAPLGLLSEPPDPSTPEGEHELYARILTFHQCRLNAAVSEFDDLNTRLANTIPADPDAEIAKLNQLAKIVEARKEDVAKAEAAFANTQWEKNKRIRLQAEQERIAKFKEFQSRRMAVRV